MNRSIVAVAFGTLACASSGTRPAPDTAITRSGAECEPVRARTATWGVADAVGLRPPAIRMLPKAPIPPAHLRQSRVIIDMRVSETGDLIPDSTRFTGIDDPGYLVALRRSLLEMRFSPAVLDGCAVSARTILMIGPFAR